MFSFHFLEPREPLLGGLQLSQRAGYIRFWEACSWLCPLFRGQWAGYIRFWRPAWRCINFYWLDASVQFFIGAIDVSIPCYRFDVRFNTFTLLNLLRSLFFGSVVGSVRCSTSSTSSASSSVEGKIGRRPPHQDHCRVDLGKIRHNSFQVARVKGRPCMLEESRAYTTFRPCLYLPHIDHYQSSRAFPHKNV